MFYVINFSLFWYFPIENSISHSLLSYKYAPYVGIVYHVQIFQLNISGVSSFPYLSSFADLYIQF